MGAERPIYETAGDRQRELAVARRLAEREGFRVAQMPKRYHVDYAMVGPGGEITGWFEVKCRRNPMRQYPTYMLSYGKYQAMLQLARDTWMDVRLIVEWTDCVGALTVPAEHKIAMGGRTDRADWQDVEPVALFPISCFTILGQRKGARE